MTKNDILHWLRESDESVLCSLWEQADAVRRDCVGDGVHLRGLIEMSNICARECHYCGLRAGHAAISRYRMTAEEVIACAHEAVEYGYGTVVLQSGEDYGITRQWMCDLIARLRDETPLAITLSLGERPDEDLVAWREAGADRYLLRFETSNRRLYDRIHPTLPGLASDRFAILRRLRELDYEVGSGVMVGIPGQSFEDLAEDIEWFRRLDLDMIGVGPYLPHPETPLGREDAAARLPDGRQVPNSDLMTCKVLALTRLVCPYANLPSTTALATVNPDNGRELGLMRGANIVMPNLTPPEYRCKYEIYPDKACLHETARHCQGCLRGRITTLGRTVGVGAGGSPNWLRRRTSAVAANGHTR